MATIDPVKRIEALLDQAEPLFRREFLAMVRAIQNERTIEELAELLSQGRIEEALSSIERATARLRSAWSDIFVIAGKSTTDPIKEATGEIIIDFDRVNARAVRVMQENQLRLVQQFGEQQRRATREALIDGIRRGINPREQARAFRDSIGLTENQQGAVSNYRRLLETLDRAALTRKLRDGRFDGTIRSAIAQDRSLTKQQIDRMVSRYLQRSLAHRAEVIARTEALRSVHMGSREMYDQAIENGVLSAEQLVRIWNTAGDLRVRGHHAFMHLQERSIGVPFTSGLGNSLMFPADPGAPAEDVVQCRCVESTRILSLEELQGVLAVAVA